VNRLASLDRPALLPGSGDRAPAGDQARWGRSARVALLSLWLSLGLALLSGCDGAPGDAPTGRASAAVSTCPTSQTTCAPCEGGGSRVVDATLLAFLSQARAAHHLADLAEQKGDPAAAIAALDKLARSDAAREPRAPEIAEVLADTLARLADLRSAAGSFDAAQDDVTRGLSLAKEPTYFRGRLFEVRGLVLERREKALRQKGELEAANRAREDAIRAYEEATLVQDAVQKRALP
jgi:tetratricopeptide (TPR) repeat protein